MINHHSASKAGFTLIETIIYVALFSILFTGILVSSYSFFIGAQQISAQVVKENESAFVARKIAALLQSANAITAPSSGNSGTSLTFSTYAGDTYSFTTSADAITLSKNGGTPAVLSADRVVFSSFSATHTAAFGGVPRKIEYSFMVDGNTFGPIRTYLTF
jgi:Tfp pilus assembly protein PilE